MKDRKKVKRPRGKRLSPQDIDQLNAEERTGLSSAQRYTQRPGERTRVHPSGKAGGHR